MNIFLFIDPLDEDPYYLLSGNMKVVEPIYKYTYKML